jgi:hypothetical protein
MKKVFVVMDREDGEINGVFSSMELAEQAVDLLAEFCKDRERFKIEIETVWDEIDTLHSLLFSGGFGIVGTL